MDAQAQEQNVTMANSSSDTASGNGSQINQNSIASTSGSSSVNSGNSSANADNRRQISREDYVELKYRRVKDVTAEKLSTGLGWFSIGLGLAEVLVPGKLGQLIGVGDNHEILLPALGLREIGSGVGILMQPRPAGWMWSRVAGDAMDLALLGTALFSPGTQKSRVLAATAAVIGVTAMDVMCAQMLSQDLDETAGNPMAPTTIGQSSARKSVEDE